MTEAKRFNILHKHGCPNIVPHTIPWAMIELHARQAFANHYQTLEQLHKRGGLTPEELYCVLQDLPYEWVNRSKAIAFLLAEIREFMAQNRNAT